MIVDLNDAAAQLMAKSMLQVEKVVSIDSRVTVTLLSMPISLEAHPSISYACDPPNVPLPFNSSTSK